MAAGFPTKSNWATGDILTAAQMDDLAGTVNQLAPAAKGSIKAGSAANAVTDIAVGADGQLLTADSTAAGGVKWAAAPASGITWTGRVANYMKFASIAYNGTNLYAAAGSYGQIWTSPDGATWTSRTSGFGTSDIYSIAYGNGLWVAVGESGLLSTSSDGTTWTTRTSGLGTNGINQVIYANSLWVAVGRGASTTGGIATSSDGITWTRRTISGTLGTQIRCVAYGNGYWVVGSDLDTGNAAYSTNGTSWTAFSSGTGYETNWCIYTNGYWYLGSKFSTSATPRRQASVPTGSWTALNGYINVNSDNISDNANKFIQVYNGNFYIISEPTTKEMSFLYKASTTFTTIPSWGVNGGVTTYSPAIPIPFEGYSTTNPTAFYVNPSNGNMILGTSNGSLYTSF